MSKEEFRKMETSEDPVVMNPVLWGSLPRELLALVLARLPVPKITRLRCQLSKEWTIKNTEFNQVRDEANPNMVALVSYAFDPNEFSVRILDFSKYVWLYEYRFRLANWANWANRASRYQSTWMPTACDGGLVCIVSNWNSENENPIVYIVVINPLTRVQHELPPLRHAFTAPPTLGYMKVDSETKGYKVIVVFKNEDRHTIETYDSVLKEWSRAVPSWGTILGHAQEWEFRNPTCFLLKYSSPCAFGLEEGHLELLDCNSLFQSEEACVVQYAFAGDGVFVLLKELNRYDDIGSEFYFITEYQFQKGPTVWVLVMRHGQCFPQDGDDLHACEDVLMLRNHNYSTKQICSFLNISTHEWHNLPENSLGNLKASLMCRVSWSASP